MSFNLLSDEIVLEVIGSLDVHRNQSLRNIALCSKRLNRMIIPLIYEELEIHTWDKETLLLRTLLENPQNGNFCKSLLVSRNYREDSIRTSKEVREARPSVIIEARRAPSSDGLAHCQTRIEIFCKSPNEAAKWSLDLQNKERDALTSLLLSCLPNLKTVELACYPGQPGLTSLYLKRVLEHAAMLQSQGSDSPYALSKLTTVKGAFDGMVPHSSFIPFLRLDSLKFAEFDDSMGDTSPPVESPTLNLENLVIKTAIDGSWSHLEGLFSQFKGLKTLRLHEHDAYRDPYNESEPYEMDEAISSLRHSLEELEIVQYPRRPDPPWISSLVGFHKLRKISLSTSAVLFKSTHRPRPRRIDVLPRSLEVLVLIGYNQYALDLLLEIIESKDEVVPKLVAIQLKKNFKDDEEDDSLDDDGTGERDHLARFEESIMRLRERCKDAAITLRLFEEKEAQGVLGPWVKWTEVE